MIWVSQGQKSILPDALLYSLFVGLYSGSCILLLLLLTVIPLLVIVTLHSHIYLLDIRLLFINILKRNVVFCNLSL